MLTFTLQCLVTALFIGFGAVAIAVGRYPSAQNPWFPHAWRLTGIAFLVHGIDQAAQNVWGGVAMAAGVNSAAMRGYLAAAPGFNHSRTFLWLGFFAALVWFVRRDGPVDGRFWARVSGLLGIGLLAGAVLGTREGSITAALHFSRVAIWDAVELIAMLLALYVALVSGRLDRHLWAALSTYGLTVALNVMWLAAAAMLDSSRVWSPSPWMIAAYRLVLVGFMFTIVVRRWAMARRGTSSVGLFADDRPFRAHTLS